jgi:poly(A) polymerase
MKEILGMQARFDNRRGARAVRLLEHKRFRAAYDFLLLRSQCGETPQEVADWWTRIQELPESERSDAFGSKRRRGGRRRRGGARASGGEARDAAH